MKENYETPVMEIVAFETEDVITASTGVDEGDSALDGGYFPR